MEIPEPVLLMGVSVLSSAMTGAGTWALTKYKADQAERSAKASHTRLDDHEKRLTKLEVGQDYHARRLEEALQLLRGSVDELRRQVNHMAQLIARTAAAHVVDDPSS